jgi:DDE superfamily endonuclease
MICFDEKSLQLLADPARYPGRTVRSKHPRRQDYEYVRHGTHNIFLWVEPKVGYRHTLVTLRRTKDDFAKAMRYLVDVMYPAPRVERIDLVMDNLNTHTTDTLIEIFGKPEADRILSRVAFHYTPLHASWTNIAEIEFSAMTSQCLDRRIPDEWTLATELVAWELRRNQTAQPIRWSFTWKRARRLFIDQVPNAAVIST